MKMTTYWVFLCTIASPVLKILFRLIKWGKYTFTLEKKTNRNRESGSCRNRDEKME